MDREALAAQLEAGRSIEAIARESGRAASTVVYWVNKHGLTSQHAARHTPRGGIERDRLQALVEEGLSIRAMAEQLGVSYTAVRHWLGVHGVQTPRARRLAETLPARSSGADTTEAHCPVHGLTTFVRRATDGFRCRLGRTGAVQRRRRELKRVLVEDAGALASCADTTGRCPASTSITSIARRRSSRSRGRASRGRSNRRARRPASASSCARTAMPR
jgi:transposase-like protein